jgi:hypothetical protein
VSGFGGSTLSSCCTKTTRRSIRYQFLHLLATTAPQEPASAHGVTELSIFVKDAFSGATCGVVEIGIRENESGSLAINLHHYRHEILCGDMFFSWQKWSIATSSSFRQIKCAGGLP